jgi:hypothetical protein
MSNTTTLQWFEIGILDYSKQRKRQNKLSSFDVIDNTSDIRGFGHDAGWRFRKSNTNPSPNMRTIFRQAKDKNRAMRIAEKLGTVLFCQKVDTSYHFLKIEGIDLKQKPITVSIELEDEFILNAKGELTPTMKATRTELEKKYELAIDLSD